MNTCQQNKFDENDHGNTRYMKDKRPSLAKKVLFRWISKVLSIDGIISFLYLFSLIRIPEFLYENISSTAIRVYASLQNLARPRYNISANGVQCIRTSRYGPFQEEIAHRNTTYRRKQRPNGSHTVKTRLRVPGTGATGQRSRRRAIDEASFRSEFFAVWRRQLGIYIVWAVLGSGSAVISCVVRRSTDSFTMANGTIQEDQYSHVTNQLTTATKVREFRQSYGEKYLPWLSTRSVIRWVNGLNSLHLWFRW